MKNIIYTLLCGFLGLTAFSQNSAPYVSNVSVDYSWEARTFTINYDLHDNEDDEVTVVLQQKNGDGFFLTVESGVVGDVGPQITQGTNKSIVYTHQGIPPSNIALRLFVYDAHVPTIQEMIDQVDKVRLKTNIEEIIGPRSATNYTFLQEIEDHLESKLVDYQLSINNHVFTFGGKNYKNIIGNREGLYNNKLCLMNGHLDCVADGPGADDNGTGVSATLEAARIMSNYYFENNVQFCFFNLEELGLIGSTQYVNNGIAPEHEIVGLINFDMLGYYSDEPNSQTLPPGFGLLFPEAALELEENEYRGDFIITAGADGSEDILYLYRDLVEIYTPDLRIATLKVPGNGSIAQDLRRSDHAPFWDKGYPALSLTDGANTRNPYYHTANDSLGTINFDIMSDVVKSSLATFIEIAKPLNATANEIDLSGILSVEELVLANQIQIWPNPSDKLLNIRFEGQNNFEVRVLSKEGRMVSKNEFAKSSDNEYVLDVSSLIKGSYILQIIDGERVYHKHFIK